MTLRTRLLLVTVLGLIGLAGMATGFYVLLPEQANEWLRREAQTRLEQAAENYLADLSRLAEPARSVLPRIADDPKVAVLARSPGGGADDLARHVELARRLCEGFSLDNLVLIDNTGVLRSLHPEAARIGFRDPARLEIARQAAATPIFIRPFVRVAERKRAGDAEGPLMAVAAAKDVAGGQLWVMTAIEAGEEELRMLAARNGAELAWALAAGSEGPERQAGPEETAVAVNGPDGNRVLTVALHPTGHSGRLVTQLISRRILLFGLPWVLLFSFFILWIGWPPRK